MVLLSILLATNVGALLAALVFIVAPLPFVILNAVPPLVLAFLWPVVSVLSAYNYLSAVTREEERAATPEPVG